MCLHLAAHGAKIKKRFDSGIFRRMKVRAFQRAGVGPTREFGLVRRGHMGVTGALEEAARVLGEEEEVVMGRVEDEDRGLLRRFVEWMLE